MSSDGNNSKNIAPFTMFSSSAEGGYLTELHTNFTGGIEINNLHTDTYGEFRHPPAQGTFTNKFVGGNTHRHHSVGQADRMEAFSVSFGSPQSFLFESTTTEVTPIAGAPAGTDLMFELDGGGNIQPLDPPADNDAVWEIDGDGDITTGLPNGAGTLFISRPTRPVLYRDEYAKRSVNIKNIRQQSPGNFAQTRDVIHTSGRTLNPGQARAAAYSVTYPLFPRSENPVLNVSGTNSLEDYAMPELSSSASAHVFVNRFSSPGDRYTMSRGFLNPIGEEYSAYNATPFRNLNVREENNENLTTHNEQFSAQDHPVNRNPNYDGLISAVVDSDEFVVGDNLTVVGTTVTNPGVSSFTEHFYSQDGSPRYAAASATWGSGNFFFSLNDDPPLDADFHTLNFAWFLVGGTLAVIYESDVSQGSFPASPTDVFSIVYDGNQVQYLQNGTVQRTVVVDAPAKLYFDSALGGPSEMTDASFSYLRTDYDNANVTHAIPQNTLQYSWINDSAEDTISDFQGFATGSDITFYSDTIGFDSPMNSVHLDEDNNTQDFDFTGSVYGYNTWKQIRGGNLKLSRYYRENSILAAANNKDIITQFSEPAVVAKHKPMEHVIGIDSTDENYTVKSPYGNELVRHSNEEINELFAYIRSDEGTSYTQLKDNYINRSIDDPANPVKRFVSMTYGETVFPRSKNAFKSKVRIRGNYTEVAGTGENGYDRRFGSQNTMYSSTGRRNSSALNSQGLLTYALAFDPMKTDGANSFLSAPGHNGNVGEMNYDFDETHFVIDPDGYVRPHLNFFETNHAYVASTDTDYNERLVEEMSGKTRWYDSYDLYQENSRGLLPEASVIPEFRISEHMDYYIEDAAGNFRADNKKFLTLLGHENSSSAAARASVNFDTDFEDTILDSEKMEHFDKIKKDHTGHSRPRKLTLTAAGVKKLLPYNGFYPDTRTVQLGNLLSQSIAPNIQGYLTVPGNPSKAEQFLDTDPVQGHAAILKTIASPGILYNTTKAGLAVDYPIYTSQPETASLSDNPTNVLVLSSDVTASTRLPFETLVNLNENLPRDERVFLVGAHPHQTTDGSFADSSLYYGKWNGKKKPYFEIASHNYLAESVNFFLKNSEVNSFISKPQNEFAEVEADKTYYMDVVLRDEVQMNKFAEYSGVTSSFPTHEVIEANMDLEIESADDASTSTAVAQDNNGGAFVLFGIPEKNKAYLTHTNKEGNSINLSETFLTGAVNQLYGAAVAMESGSDGLYFAIGAPEIEGLSTTGSMYAYRYTASGVELLGSQDTLGSSGEGFGSSVALVSGSDAVYYATCLRNTAGVVTDPTVAYGFKYQAGTFDWLNSPSIPDSNAAISNYSGSCSVTISSGSTAICIGVATQNYSGGATDHKGHWTALTSSNASPQLVAHADGYFSYWGSNERPGITSISSVSINDPAYTTENEFFFLLTAYPFTSLKTIHQMIRISDVNPSSWAYLLPIWNSVSDTHLETDFGVLIPDDFSFMAHLPPREGSAGTVFERGYVKTSMVSDDSDPRKVYITLPTGGGYTSTPSQQSIKIIEADLQTQRTGNYWFPENNIITDSEKSSATPKPGYEGANNSQEETWFGAGVDIDVNSSADIFISTGYPALNSNAGSVHLIYSAPRTDLYSQHGRLFGSPLDGAYDPAYVSYTPPGFHGERVATVSFSSSVGGIVSLDEILKSAEISDKESIKEGQVSQFSGDNSSLTVEQIRAKMPIESSVSLFGKTKQPDVEFQISETGEATRVDRAKSAGASAFRWAISTKYECPVIDVSSSLYADNYTSHLADEDAAVWGFSGSSGQFSHPRSVWTSYGQATSPDKGYFFELRESTSKGTNDGSLVELCGFTPGTKKIGSVADNKVISEAIMVVPYTSQAIKNKTVEIESGKHFFRLNNAELKRQKRSVEDNGYAVSEDLRETSISELIQGMKDYVIPPHYNFLQYKDIKPFACYFLEFEHTLSQRDLIDIWQGITPSIALNPETDEVEVSHDINKHNLFHNIDIPSDIKFMIFKVKKQAMWNYYDITTDSTDDNRFRFDFQGDGKVEVVPEYNYNWPYDFFSLVERAKVDVDITFKKDDEE